MDSLEDFQNRLKALPPDQQNQMLTLLKVISQPPETILNLFDRLGLPWNRTGDEMVIKWSDFTKAEKENQEQGPILKRLLRSEFGDIATQQVDVDSNGQVVKRELPKLHKIEGEE